MRCAVLGLAALVTTPFLGQDAAPPFLAGVPHDWSHHHLIFSAPATAGQAARLRQEPRYWHQWYHRNGAFQSQNPFAQLFGWGKPDPHARGLWGESLSGSGTAGTVGAGNYPAKFSFNGGVSCSDFVVFNTSLGGTSSQASIGAFNNLYSTTCNPTVPTVNWAYNTGGTISTSVVLSWSGNQVAFMHLETITMSKTATATAAGVALTINSVTGFLGNTTNGSAVVTLTAGTVGSSAAGQTITGSGIQSSTTISSIASASLNILKWNASTTQTFASPGTLTPVAASSYYNCTAPCFTSIPFATAANDTSSSPFYDYTTNSDVLYVGDNSGKLHKFQHVFNSISGNPPGEVTTSGWPVPVSGNVLTSPTYDATSSNVFVGDSGGFLYSFSPSGTLTGNSSRLAIGTAGIVDAPLVDSSAKTVYVFVGQDANTTTGHNCDNATGCDGVFQFSIPSFTSSTGNTGTSCASSDQSNWTSGTNCGSEAILGRGSASTVLYAGDFDQLYYGGSGGNLWTCGATATPSAKVNFLPVGSFSLSTTPHVFIANGDNTALTSTSSASTCSPVTEIYNTGSSTDWIYLSVTANGSGTGCTGACVYSFNVTSTPSTGCSAGVNGGQNCTFAASAGIPASGGSSGIIIDNTASGGGSQLYFSYLSAATSTIKCPSPSGASSGGCAVQASQAALQ